MLSAIIIEANEQELALLYNRARASYTQCLKDNEYLREEAPVPLEAIVVRDAAVKIVFHQSIIADYLIEVELSLYANDSYMGRYTYSENKGGDGVEDGLVFY